MNGIRRLCGTVLAMEAVILGLAILPAIRLEHANGPLAGGVGGGLAVCALLLSGMVGRPRTGWAVKAGTVLQLLFIAAGVVLPAMYVLGVIFAALWFTGIWLARRWETPAAGTADMSAVPGAITPETADKAPPR
jgi:Protein of unknown function (DUF4233)